VELTFHLDLTFLCLPIYAWFSDGKMLWSYAKELWTSVETWSQQEGVGPEPRY